MVKFPLSDNVWQGIYASIYLLFIGTGNDMLPALFQAITWTFSVLLLSLLYLGTHFSEL